MCVVFFRVFGFRRAHAPGHMGPEATTWVPMGARVPILAPNDNPNPSQWRKRGLGKVKILKNCQPTHASLKNGKAFMVESSVSPP